MDGLSSVTAAQGKHRESEGGKEAGMLLQFLKHVFFVTLGKT